MITAITTENLDDCINAYLKAYNGPPWNYNWTYDNAKKYLSEYMESSRFAGFVLYDEGQLAGATFGHIKTWWTGEQLMIDELFISGDKQGKGYGKKLLEFWEQYSSENKITSVVLMTNQYMPSYGFYNKVGYTTAEQFVFMFKPIM